VNFLLTEDLTAVKEEISEHGEWAVCLSPTSSHLLTASSSDKGRLRRGPPVWPPGLGGFCYKTWGMDVSPWLSKSFNPSLPHRQRLTTFTTYNTYTVALRQRPMSTSTSAGAPSGTFYSPDHPGMEKKTFIPVSVNDLTTGSVTLKLWNVSRRLILQRCLHHSTLHRPVLPCCICTAVKTLEMSCSIHNDVPAASHNERNTPHGLTLACVIEAYPC
jgi:hypothetical protein